MEENFLETRQNLFQTEETLSWLDNDIYTENLSIKEKNIFEGSEEPSSFLASIPQRDPLYVIVPITIIYLSLFFTGIVGNISTCIVIARNKSMHTATNYYLFSLAISDLLLLIFGLPVEVYLVWEKYSYIFGEGFCIFRGLAAECSTNASVLTITAFTVERYVAICHPFRSHTMSNLSRAIKLIIIIWIVALIFATPLALQFGIYTWGNPPEISVCLLKRILYEHSFDYATLLFFVLPMVLITILYIMIGLKLRQSNMMKRDNGRTRSVRDSSTSGNNTNNSINKERNCRHHTGRSSRRVLKMLVAVVVAFFVCWAPFHVQRLIAVYGTNPDHITSTSRWMAFFYVLFTYVSGVLYYVSATINPILYNIMSNKFREAFMETLARNCGGSGFSVQREQRSYSSLSRSQQRGTGGMFGSRTVGTGGTGIVQDSINYSNNNSMRDETLQRSPSVSGQQTFTTNFDNDYDTGQIMVPNDTDQISSDLSRNTSYNDASNRTTCSEARLNLLDNSNRLPIIHGRSRENRSFIDRTDKSKRYRKNIKILSNNKTTIGKNNRVNKTSENRQQYEIGKIESDVASRKKWWRLFVWLPDSKVFKFSNTRSRSNPTDRMVNDIESNREEYSMTSCYGRNDTDQRPV